MILGIVFSVLGTVLMAVLIVGSIAFSCWFIRSWNREKRLRQEEADAHRMRHGGQAVLEWTGPRAAGEPDSEFGPMLVELPRRSGSGSAAFYKYGAVIGKKRVCYEELKDVVFLPGEPGPSRTLKRAVQNSAVLWLYRNRGPAIGIRDFQYEFNAPVMEAIQRGLGYQSR